MSDVWITMTLFVLFVCFNWKVNIYKEGLENKSKGASAHLTLLATAYSIPLCHGEGGVDSTPPLENTLGGLWNQLFFYRIINLYKTNPKAQTPSFENGALKFFWKANFSTISELRKNMVSGKNLCHSLKF